MCYNKRNFGHTYWVDPLSVELLIYTKDWINLFWSRKVVQSGSIYHGSGRIYTMHCFNLDWTGSIQSAGVNGVIYNMSQKIGGGWESPSNSGSCS